LFGPGFADGYPLMVVLAAGPPHPLGPWARRNGALSMIGQQRTCALIYATAFATKPAALLSC